MNCLFTNKLAACFKIISLNNSKYVNETTNMEIPYHRLR